MRLEGEGSNSLFEALEETEAELAEACASVMQLRNDLLRALGSLPEAGP